MWRSTPGYQFNLDEGRNQLESSAAARGSLYSGAALKDLTKYGQNYADRTYGDDGNLTPRSQPHAMIHDAAQAVAHVRRMVQEQAIFSLSGKKATVIITSCEGRLSTSGRLAWS